MGGNQGIYTAAEKDGGFRLNLAWTGGVHSKKVMLMGRISIALVGQAGTQSSQTLHFF